MAKTTRKGQQFVGGEISKLMKKGPSKGPLKGQKFTQKRAVAAALNVARKKGYKVPVAKEESMSMFDGLVFDSSGSLTVKFSKRGSATRHEATSLFDGLVVAEGPVAQPENQDGNRYARALALVESLSAIHKKFAQ